MAGVTGERMLKAARLSANSAEKKVDKGFGVLLPGVLLLLAESLILAPELSEDD